MGNPAIRTQKIPIRNPTRPTQYLLLRGRILTRDTQRNGRSVPIRNSRNPPARTATRHQHNANRTRIRSNMDKSIRITLNNRHTRTRTPRNNTNIRQQPQPAMDHQSPQSPDHNRPPNRRRENHQQRGNTPEPQIRRKPPARANLQQTRGTESAPRKTMGNDPLEQPIRPTRNTRRVPDQTRKIEMLERRRHAKPAQTNRRNLGLLNTTMVHTQRPKPQRKKQRRHHIRTLGNRAKRMGNVHAQPTIPTTTSQRQAKTRPGLRQPTIRRSNTRHAPRGTNQRPVHPLEARTHATMAKHGQRTPAKNRNHEGKNTHTRPSP